MDESTRSASLVDLETVLALQREGRAPLRDVRGGGLWLDRQAIPEPLELWYRSAIGAEDWLVQLSSIDSVPLGLLVAQIQSVDDVRLAVVRELFVVPEARGVGLGELMMDATLGWAEQSGCQGVDGYAFPGDRATKNFFETFGLVARGIVVHRPIGR